MRLTFSNVGRFVEKTEVEIKGITVIAGTNGTGKSSISKILYCLFDSLYDTDSQIEENKLATIERILTRPIRGVGRLNSMYDIAHSVLYGVDDSTSDEEIVELLKNSEYPFDQLDATAIKDVVNQISSALDVSDEEILEELVLSRFYAEFNNCVQHVNFQQKATEIELTIRDNKIHISIDKGMFSLNNEFEIVKDMVYLDDLSSFNNISIRVFTGYDSFSHSVKLRKKIYEAKADKNDVLDKILAENRYNNIIQKINKLEIGDLVKTPVGNMEYKVDGLNENLSMQNVSAGTKVLAVIKKLISNGYIEENGMIVLDEPEVHLHPEWQLALAEMIVVMQKEMGVNVLINTHSADFLAFIQYFSQKQGIAEKCKYYLTVANKDYTSTLKDVSDDIQEIFSELGTPFIRVTEEIDD